MDKNSLQVHIDDSKCDLCGTCVGVCPENVIGMSIAKLTIDHNGCTRCNKCIWVCPVRALSLIEVTKNSIAASGIEKNTDHTIQ
ncbi:MAG: 4Fe-4S binding protein [Calditrichota bacterium]|jgi:ferredoxin